MGDEIIRDVTNAELMELSEEEIYDLSSRCFELLGRLEKFKYIRQRQARSGMGAYKGPVQ